MELSFLHKTGAFTLCLMLFLSMLLMVGIGRFAGELWRKDTEEPKGGVNSLLAALFALFGFILAFTFGMSGNRFESSRTIFASEANDISTAILRADLYPDSVRDGFRKDFKDYLETRISYYDLATDTSNYLRAKKEAGIISGRLWKRATDQSKQPNMLIPSNLMVPALNAMFDIATTADVLLTARVPDPIVYMLFMLALACSFIGGFTTRILRPKDWIIIVGFALLSSMIIYITLDLGRPMRGIIRADSGQQAIHELRKMFE